MNFTLFFTPIIIRFVSYFLSATPLSHLFIKDDPLQQSKDYHRHHHHHLRPGRSGSSERQQLFHPINDMHKTIWKNIQKRDAYFLCRADRRKSQKVWKATNKILWNKGQSVYEVGLTVVKIMYERINCDRDGQPDICISVLFTFLQISIFFCFVYYLICFCLLFLCLLLTCNCM